MDDRSLALFMAKVHKAENGCWIWTGCRLKSATRGSAGYQVSGGYGLFDARGHTRRAHRVAYEHFVGEIPAGLTLDHACHTTDLSCPGGNACEHRACVNPAHLVPMARKENVLSGRGLSAENARKTHCAKGHEYTPQNTMVTPRQRRCRECMRIATRAAYRRAHPEAKVRGTYRKA